MEITGIITNALFAKFATEVKQIEEEIQLKQIMSDSSYTGTINDLLGSNSSYNNKLIVQEGNLVYVASEVSSQEKEWLGKLGIEESSDYYTVEFNTSGGNEKIEPQTIRVGKLVNKPSNPTKEDCSFIGWYYLKEVGSDENITYEEIAFDFTTTITSNYSLYAKYTNEALLQIRKDNYAFWTEDYKQNITNISFKKGEIPELPDTTPAWYINIQNDKSSKILAYIENDYELTIISPSTIYANSYCRNFFRDFSSVLKISFDNFDTSRVGNMQYMFYNCYSLTTLDLSNFDVSKVMDMQSMFFNCSNLQELNLNNFYTPSLKGSLYGMFEGCSKLTYLNIDNLDITYVTSLGHMFYECNALSTLNLNSFNTTNNTSMLSMFYNCKSLETLDLHNFKTENLITMQSTFYGCSKLTKLNLNNFYTPNLGGSLYGTFYGCERLIELSINNLDTNNVTSMNFMFSHCDSLTTLDLSSFNTSNVTNMGNMFSNNVNLRTIYVGNGWTTSNATTNYMFSGCGVNSVTAKDI